MNFIDLAKKRYSVRSYTEQKVEKEKLDLILEAARVAPTGANKQPYRLIVIQQEEGLKKLSKAVNTFHAPCVIIVCGNRSEAWIRPLDGKNIIDIDASIVTDHMMHEATDLGLGTCWICYFKTEILREEFKIPEQLEPINILAIGYTDKDWKSPDRHEEVRKPLTETVFYESF